ncbi:hypothetical protein KY284_005041 [Solanum tuberosum]|nr:hypothetical protein KY284_005041 [Solanum tuberosum]
MLAKIAAASQQDRKDICLCLKTAMRGSRADYSKAKQLPDLCHYTSFMPFEPNPDCSNSQSLGSGSSPFPFPPFFPSCCLDVRHMA